MLISPEAEALFNEALTLAPEQRKAFLARSCDKNPELLDEVSSLLTAANESEAYFDDLSGKVGLTALAEPQNPTIDGKILGQWKLVRLLGRGGMGSVYLAKRADGQFEKNVALKTLPIGLDNELARTRFINERQILARLVHDNIARLLDGGVSDDGTPYFVMDYVEGIRIDEYCDQNKCSVEQCIDLILEVASGVRFAHRNLIIHRDLKPTNILVDAAGHARLLDFGIAKVLESTEEAEVTRIAQRPVTPAYASPEMLRGEAVDVTTDVYSLGAVLYQLLTGALPLEVSGLSLAELYIHVSQVEPESASKLNSKIDSDMDAILGKALAKDASERYTSIESLAQDLSNWRQGKPVIAKAPSAFYRAGKFVRRNVAGVALASLAVLSLAGFATFATYSAARSEQQSIAIAAERDRAEATKDFLVSIFDAAGPNEGGEKVTAAQILEAGRLRVNTEFADQPRLRAEMLRTMAYVYSIIGANDKWRELLIEAKDLVAEIEGANSRPYFEVLVDLSAAEDMLGNYDASYDLTLEILSVSRVLGDGVSEGQARKRLGRILHLRGDYKGADKEYRASLALFQEAFGNDDYQTAASKVGLATLLDQMQQHQQAYDLFRDVEATHKRIEMSEEIVQTDLYLGMAKALANMDRHDEALVIYQRTLDQNKKIYGEDNYYNLYIYNGMSIVAEAKGDYGKALELQNGVFRLIKMHSPDSPNLGRSLLSLGRIYQASSLCELALPNFREALNILEAKLPNHAVVGQAKWRLGACLAEFNQNDEAETLLVDANKILAEHLASDHKNLIDAKNAAAVFFTDTGRPELAEAYR